MSLAHLGKPHPHTKHPMSREAREKIAASKRGKPRPPETIRKMVISHIGKSQTPESNAKRSKTLAGRAPPNKGIPRSEETKAKISKALKGRTVSPEHRAKLAAYCGEKANNWQGGISFEPYCPKFNLDLRRRVRAFFDYRCVLCGKTEVEIKRRNDVHHVEYNKLACCDGLPVQFVALCHRCHSRTNSKRSDWESMLHTIIYEIYNNRSYYTKTEWENVINEPCHIIQNRHLP